MTPDTDPRKLFFHKFIRVGNRIFYDEPLKDHSKIADENGVPHLVNDAGYVEPVGKFPYPERRVKFVLKTQTCFISGDPKEARQETVKVAGGILGNEHVSL